MKRKRDLGDSKEDDDSEDEFEEEELEEEDDEEEATAHGEGSIEETQRMGIEGKRRAWKKKNRASSARIHQTRNHRRPTWACGDHPIAILEGRTETQKRRTTRWKVGLLRARPIGFDLVANDGDVEWEKEQKDSEKKQSQQQQKKRQTDNDRKLGACIPQREKRASRNSQATTTKLNNNQKKMKQKMPLQLHNHLHYYYYSQQSSCFHWVPKQTKSVHTTYSTCPTSHDSAPALALSPHTTPSQDTTCLADLEHPPHHRH